MFKYEIGVLKFWQIQNIFLYCKIQIANFDNDRASPFFFGLQIHQPTLVPFSIHVPG